MWNTWEDGLGSNAQPTDARERERLARISGAALSTVTPGGVYVPMPFNLPDGSVAIGRKARTGPGGRLDPWTDVVVLLRPDGSPGPAYSWPVTLTADAFISPGSAAGFPVRDFYCGFHPGICDHLTRAAGRLGPNPAWGRPSGTPISYTGGGAISAEVQRLLATKGLTRDTAKRLGPGAGTPIASGAQYSLPDFILPKQTEVGWTGKAMDTYIRPAPVGTVREGQVGTTAASTGGFFGLPEQIDLFGFRVSPLVLIAGAVGAWFLLKGR